MKVHYLEIVTPEVDATCQSYSQLHQVSFSDSQAWAALGLPSWKTAAWLVFGLHYVKLKPLWYAPTFWLKISRPVLKLPYHRCHLPGMVFAPS